ncbi:hypothetical protein HDV06_000290 [Boothiomyces sp. JEL0866]|nr:hypothetical protein HDV06_000290 [Boothiomyces sp. JEL0866]
MSSLFHSTLSRKTRQDLKRRFLVHGFLVLILLYLVFYRRAPTNSEKSVEPIISEKDKATLAKYHATDISVLGEHLRLYKKYHLISGSCQSPEICHFKGLLDEKLFNWIQPSYLSTLDFQNSFNGTGIVLCVYDAYAKLAISTMQMIRKVHKSNIPFEVFYIGNTDLSEENQRLIEKIPFTKTRDITKIFNNDILQLKGWAIKPFAMLASSFENAMLIDADVVFLQSPELLFASKLYQENKALFYHDRSLFKAPKKTLDWVRNILPKPITPSVADLRIFNEKTAHEMESGVVLINKKERFVGLLAVAILNGQIFRKQSYEHFHGDKETFWTGFEAVSENYVFSPHLPGITGVAKQIDGETEICGMQLLHLDETKAPMWINGGLAESKYDDGSPLVDLRDWMSEPGKWKLQPGNQACLYNSEEPMKFSISLLDTIQKSGEFFNVQSPDSHVPQSGEVWPVGYSVQAVERTLASGCLGITVKVPFSGSCCASFIGSTTGIASASTVYVQDSTRNAAPTLANGHRYCFLQSSENSTILGFSSAWYLGDGSCSPTDNISCSTSGILSVYPNGNCQGVPKSFQLTANESTISFNNVANVQASFADLTTGQTNVGWIASVPLGMLAPNFANPIVPVILVLIIAIFFGMLYGTRFLYLEYMEKRTGYMLGLLISQIAWTISIVTLTMSKFPAFSGTLFTGITFVIVDLASLVSVITVSSFLMQFLAYGQRTKYVIYAIIIMVNLIMGSSKYLFFIQSFPDRVRWDRIALAWLFGFAFYDCYPPIYVSLTLLKINSDSLSKRCRKLAKYDPWFFTAMFAHIFNVIMYVCLTIAREYTTVFQSDRFWVEFGNLSTVILGIHATLNIYLIVRLRIFVKKRSIFSSSDDYHLSGYTSAAYTSRISTSYAKNSIMLSAVPASKGGSKPSQIDSYYSPSSPSTAVMSSKSNYNGNNSYFDSKIHPLPEL